MAADTSLIGRTLAGRFRIVRCIGKGGMATVFLGEQTDAPRQVAIKVMKRELMRDRTVLRRFQREAKAAARLKHRNTVRVIDFGVDGEDAYIAMELADGKDLLQSLAEQRPMHQPRAAEIVAQVCAALEAAHQEGIIHRDLKPENIMLVEDPEAPHVELVKVLDFGIAKIVEPPKKEAIAGDEDNPSSMTRSALTRVGTIVGTPAYMSPEQCRGGELDGRSDVYSAGVLLYQLLTGQVPFLGETPLHTAMRHIHAAVRPPKELRPDLSEALSDIVLKALSKWPDDRHQTAKELESSLRSAMHGLPTGAAAGQSGSPSEISQDPTPILAARSDTDAPHTGVQDTMHQGVAALGGPLVAQLRYAPAGPSSSPSDEDSSSVAAPPFEPPPRGDDDDDDEARTFIKEESALTPALAVKRPPSAAERRNSELPDAETNPTLPARRRGGIGSTAIMEPGAAVAALTTDRPGAVASTQRSGFERGGAASIDENATSTPRTPRRNIPASKPRSAPTPRRARPATPAELASTARAPIPRMQAPPRPESRPPPEPPADDDDDEQPTALKANVDELLKAHRKNEPSIANPESVSGEVDSAMPTGRTPGVRGTMRIRALSNDLSEADGIDPKGQLKPTLMSAGGRPGVEGSDANARAPATENEGAASRPGLLQASVGAPLPSPTPPLTAPTPPISSPVLQTQKMGAGPIAQPFPARPPRRLSEFLESLPGSTGIMVGVGIGVLISIAFALLVTFVVN